MIDSGTWPYALTIVTPASCALVVGFLFGIPASWLEASIWRWRRSRSARDPPRS